MCPPQHTALSGSSWEPPCPTPRSPNVHGEKTSGGSPYNKLLFLSLPPNKGGFVTLESVSVFPLATDPESFLPPEQRGDLELVTPKKKNREEKRRQKQIVEQCENREASRDAISNSPVLTGAWVGKPEKGQAQRPQHHPHHPCNLFSKALELRHLRAFSSLREVWGWEIPRAGLWGQCQGKHAFQGKTREAYGTQAFG